MRKILTAVLAAAMLISVSLCASASEGEDSGHPETNGVTVTDMGEGHEVIRYGDVTIEDIITEEYRKIVTQSGADISEYYEDFSTGMATLSVNGVVVETYHMNELRKNDTAWQKPKEGVEIFVVIGGCILLVLVSAWVGRKLSR